MQSTAALHITLLFTIEDEPGALDKALNVFKRHEISLSHIESRPSHDFEWEYDILSEFKVFSPEKITVLEADLSSIVKRISIVSSSAPIPDTKGSIVSHHFSAICSCNGSLVPPKTRGFGWICQ